LIGFYHSLKINAMENIKKFLEAKKFFEKTIAK